MNAAQILLEEVNRLAEELLSIHKKGGVPPIEELVVGTLGRFTERVENECGQIDGKFCGLVWRRRDGEVEEQFVCFVPRDNLIVDLLPYYRQLCVDKVCGTLQVNGVDRLMERVESWRSINGTFCKNPDILPNEPGL